MSELSVRLIAINDPICPLCLEETLGGEMTGYGGYHADPIYSDGFVIVNGVEVRSWNSTCSNCRTRVERNVIVTEFDRNTGSVTEKVEPSPHGLVIRELRELKQALMELKAVKEFEKALKS